jgi:uncharacterized protein (DUF1330 family)
MKGYWIVRCHVYDPEEFLKYVEISQSIVERFGGSFLIRGGKQLEKETTGYERTVVVEFPDFNTAKECYESNEYQKALNHIIKSANRTVAIVEGLT